MALTGALFAGVSGVNANGNAMNIIGDNIANANTIGFKSSRAVFFDLLSADIGGSKIGLGSRLAASSRLFVQGGIETTNSSTDLAIQGNGLFILKDTQNGTFYSRAGQFNVDADGNLVNPAGLRVQGIALDDNGNPTSGVTDIVMGQLVAAPVATTKIELALNSTRPKPCRYRHCRRSRRHVGRARNLVRRSEFFHGRNDYRFPRASARSDVSLSQNRHGQ